MTRKTIKSRSETVQKRLGATTGASKGKALLPKPSFKAKPAKDGFKAGIKITL